MYLTWLKSGLVPVTSKEDEYKEIRLYVTTKKIQLRDKVQGFLAVVIGLVIIVCVATGVVKPYPSTWSWENAREWYSDTFYFWLLIVTLYFPGHDR